MLFTEPIFFLLFLPLLLAIYFVSPKGLRNPILICASLVFYASGEKIYLGVLLFSLLFNYFSGLTIDRSQEKRRRKLYTALAVAGNLLLLALFKYADFLVVNLNSLLRVFALPALPRLSVHLPIGISFFTFMGISYLIDVYRRELQAQRSLSNFALYITLFPHLIAGPIVRYHDIAAEIVSRLTTRSEFAEGIRKFIIGFGKKMIIANTLALPADKIFGLHADQLTTGLAWLGAACYTLQIYYDFSGYTDMAIGLARMFGFHFPENFDYPYSSSSVTEFWRRWHISLSTWFRDYLFFPLGIRRPRWRVYLNLLIVFFLCGLWHGASWNFVIWGLFHGTFLVLERAGLLKHLGRFPRPLRHAYAILVILTGWVFFRTETLTQAITYLRAMAGLARGVVPIFQATYLLNTELLIVLTAGLIGCVPVLPLLGRWLEQVIERFSSRTSPLLDVAMRLCRTASLALIFLASTALSAAGTYNPFIYFRF